MTDRETTEAREDAESLAETEYLSGIPGYAESVAEALDEGADGAVPASEVDW